MAKYLFTVETTTETIYAVEADNIKEAEVKFMTEGGTFVKSTEMPADIIDVDMDAEAVEQEQSGTG